MAKGFILVLFEKVIGDAQPDTKVIQSEEPVARHLEEELIRLKTQLRASNEQHELHAEELKASNEELQAMNEELRSAAEELETSKEELQSINEELRTVNQELKVKVEETTIASNNLQNLINSVDIGTIFLDRSFKVAFFTPAARDLFNLLPADFGRPLSDITTKLEYDDLIHDVESVLDKLQPIEHEVKTKDGRVFIMRILPYRTAEDRINGVVITFINITNVKKAEADLRASEERLRITLESAEMGTWDYVVPEDKITWNQQHYLMLGLTPDDKLKSGGYFFGFVHEDDREFLKTKLENAIAKANVFEAEFRIRRADDSNVRWMNSYGRSIERDDKGRGTRMVGVMYDITERKKLEQQKDEFIGIASHELKTPVTSIKGYTEILQDRFEKANEQESSLLMQKLNNQVDRLTNLIKDLLDTTKIVEGKLPLHLSVFNLNELVTERIEELGRLSNKHSLVLQPGRIPNITADKERIEQVLNNLVANAIKYSPKGGKIVVKTELTDSVVQVSVADQGIGISDEARQRIFERFYRANDPAAEAFPGMGLGLYISAGIVQRHGGEISVTSEVGKGSSFQFKLPIKTSAV